MPESGNPTRKPRWRQCFSGIVGHDVPLARFGTPVKPDYWKAVDDLGFGRVALLLPTRPKDESLKLLDEYATAVERYRA